MKFALFIFLAQAYALTMAEPEFTPRQVVKPFDAIKNAPVVNIAKAAQFVDDNELVLGITFHNSARAYPINMLTQPTREIINDTLGKRKIAATW